MGKQGQKVLQSCEVQFALISIPRDQASYEPLMEEHGLGDGVLCRKCQQGEGDHHLWMMHLGFPRKAVLSTLGDV